MSEPRNVPRTYDTFILHSLCPVNDWQAVYYMEDHHEALPVHLLAVATRRTRYCSDEPRAGQRLYDEENEEELCREVVALEYAIGDGWGIHEEMGNFCGLLPPGHTLGEFETHGFCRHRHAAEKEA
jgi:hypothetical protein